MTDFGVSEFGVGLSFPEMVVDRALQVAHTGSPGLVGLHLEVSRGLARRRRGCGGCDGGILGHSAGLQRLFLARDIAAGYRGEQAAVGVADGPYPGLQHCDGCVCEDRNDLRDVSNGRWREMYATAVLTRLAARRSMFSSMQGAISLAYLPIWEGTDLTTRIT